MGVYYRKSRKWWEVDFKFNKIPHRKAGFKSKHEGIIWEGRERANLGAPQASVLGKPVPRVRIPISPPFQKLTLDFIKKIFTNLKYLVVNCRKLFYFGHSKWPLSV